MPLSRITAESIADGTIIAADIADGTVTNTKLAGSITSDKITSVSNTAISGLIEAAQIGSVTNTAISGVITTSQLANNLTVNASSIISSANIDFKVGASQNTAAKIDSSENLQFNSGYGSVATAYGCRAWVNFNGTGTPAIREDGNVSSITDNNTGDYTVNFTTAMPDANYSVTSMGQRNDFNNGDFNVSCIGNTSGFWSTTSVRIATAHASTFTLSDALTVALAIFR